MKKAIRLVIILSAILLSACDDQSGDDIAVQTSGSESGIGGSTARFTIDGGHLYTVDNNNINTFDLNNPATPVKTSQINVYGNEYETIFAKDGYLFFGTRNGLYIYSLSNAEKPEYVSNYQHVYSCDPVVVDSVYAYVTMRDGNSCGRSINQLEIINISDINDPVSVKTYLMSNPKGLGIDDSLLFLCDGGLKVYNKSDPKNLYLLNKFDIEANDVIPYNGLLVVTGSDGIRQYDYSQDILELLSSILINPL